MDQRDPLDSVPAVAGRLRAIRELTGLSQTDFASQSGIAYTSWNNYETAVSLISVISARKVRSFTGASLDYIYEGDRSKLPSDMAGQLDERGLRQSLAG